jgi:hypothetical protein
MNRSVLPAKVLSFIDEIAKPGKDLSYLSRADERGCCMLRQAPPFPSAHALRWAGSKCTPLACCSRCTGSQTSRTVTPHQGNNNPSEEVAFLALLVTGLVTFLPKRELLMDAG